ncbi:hypothetical protein GCM10027403_23640 [Arthrobacter tecti]
MPVQTLAPQFDEDHHGVYRDLLRRAIEHEDTRNLALTGSYGTGKSSILRQIAEIYGEKVVEISLSTSSPRENGKPPENGGENSTVETPTNRIQKEIVKQLIYRLPPSQTRGSRFPRANKPDLRLDLIWASIWGSAAYTVLIMIGLIPKFIAWLGGSPWQQVGSYLGLEILSMGLAWLVLRGVQGRIVVNSVSAGPTTVTLDRDSESYFDQYLDEIVYFFQVSECNLVIIEDIDRFEDAHVFDTLRALNRLLNSSKQLDRRIVFVYAIRDSVFEVIGKEAPAANTTHEKDETTISDGAAGVVTSMTDRARDALLRANRTKFFDVIIPVVPFITHDNARDLMSNAMRSDKFIISPALVRLASRHVADMRMIRNIRNEFEVYRNRLIATSRQVPGLTDDLLFAIVLFKSSHLGDFEEIRLQNSTLDGLFLMWRRLVSENLASEIARRTQIEARRTSEQIAPNRAKYLGTRLQECREALREGIRPGPNRATPSVTLSVNGAAVADETTFTREFWTNIADGSELIITLSDNYSQNASIQLTAEQLGNFLNVGLEQKDWGEVNLSEVTAAIGEVTEKIQFLQHHTWQQLWARQEFRVAVDDSENSTAPPLSFADLADQKLESDLARDLVRHGYLTHHFALYVSVFHGEHLGSEAMEYIMRFVEPGKFDPTYPLSETDVEQVLEDRGADLLNEPGVYNVHILDYLLAHKANDAHVIIHRLIAYNEHEESFLNTYVAQGKQTRLLFAQMAPLWPSIFRYIAADAPAESNDRLAQFNSALGACAQDIDYETNRSVKELIESNYTELAAITSPRTSEQAIATFTLISAAGAKIDSLKDLDPVACSAAIQFSCYRVNEMNLRAITSTDLICLDALLDTAEVAYIHAVNHLSDYMAALKASMTTQYSVVNPQCFLRIVSDAAPTNSTVDVDAMVFAASEDCRVSELNSVASSVWPALTQSTRTDCSFSNVKAYLDEYGEVDRHLGKLLREVGPISGYEQHPKEARADVTLQILNAFETLPDASIRIALAEKLEPGFVDADNLKPQSGNFVAQLIRRDLLADEEETFTGRLMTDWSTLEAAILASEHFGSFVSPSILPVSELPSFIASRRIPSELKQAVVGDLVDYLSAAEVREVQAIAAALNKHNWTVGYARLEALRVEGTNNHELVPLIAREGDKLDLGDLRTLLRAMGGSYEVIADLGSKHPTFPNDADHVMILNRLHMAHIVSSFPPDGRDDKLLRVNLHQPR